MSNAKELIHEIERLLLELKKEYTMYLNGASKVEPYLLREDLVAKLKLLRRMNHRRTEDKFRTNNIVSRVESHFSLWDRRLEKKLSSGGMARRIGTSLNLDEPPDQEEKSKPRTEKMMPPGGPVVINDVKTQREDVVALYDEYMKLNLLLGSRKMVNFSKFQNFIDSQTQKLKTQQKAEKIGYQVQIQDQKVVIKSKSIKG